MLNLPTELLRTFIKAVDLGSFTRAGDAFGGQVLDLVQFCTDGLPDAQGQKSPWRERKELYLAHLRAAEGDGVLVSACDKLAAVLELAEAKSRVA